MSKQSELLARYEASMLGVFGRPPLVLTHGDGAYVWDADGKRYLDLVGGIAVNVLGHGHPALVSAVSKQSAELVHISNLFTSEPQIRLAERLLEVAGAPEGSRVYFGNSGTEAIEAAIKLSRRTGRTGIVAATGAFHGRTTGALALTHKVAYREPFEPLIPGVTHVEYGDVAALRAAVTEEVGAVFLEAVQGEAGVIVPSREYLQAARELTSAVGALLVIDEIQTGIGRTGKWFAFQHTGIQPDAITIAKGLGGGVPIGAMVTFGESVSKLLTKGQHGTTFGGNPLACAAGLAVLDAIESEGLVQHAQEVGDYLAAAVEGLGLSQVTGVRGLGLMRAILLRDEIAPGVASAAMNAGFIINPVRPQAIRLVPPLVLSLGQVDDFVGALPGLIEAATA
ncbi:acetylornithine transaminase [Leekyejoonella antrihumi]|uniref:Acetylornithine aminotransferase n=1 Tax=Leekyejoonella antrihumi TaxID=1660198 RepID=A0A563DTU1_9MICO|nr:acetylornithine transaminase [Leekyejoonella antrihumi]TWP33341.1 acetylornithine transaminase [Leekyejoonella antrihumi]